MRMRNTAPNELVNMPAETERNLANNGTTPEQEGSSLGNDQLSKSMDVDAPEKSKDNVMIV